MKSISGIRNSALTLILFLFSLMVGYGQYTIVPITAYHDDPPAPLTSIDLHPNRINLVILADGYQTGEETLFESDRDELLNLMFQSNLYHDVHPTDPPARASVPKGHLFGTWHDQSPD